MPIAALLHACVGVDQPDEQDVLNWFTQQWQDASSLDRLAGSLVRYSVEWPAQYTHDQLSAMKARISNKPDHPLHAVVPVEERRLAQGPDVGAVHFAMDGRGAMRHSQTTTLSDGSTSSLDFVLAPDVMWSMTPDQLAVMDPDSPPPQRDFRSSLRSPPDPVCYFFSASLALPWYRPRVEMQGVETRDDHWIVTQRSTDDAHQFEIEYRIEWDETASRPFIVERRFVNRGASDRRFWIGQRETFEDWQLVPELGVWAAFTVRRFKGSELPHEIDRLTAVELVDTRELARYFDPPSFPNGSDPLRGAVSLSSMMDYAGRDHVALVVTDGGVQRTVLASQPRSWWSPLLSMRSLGWMALAGSLVCVGLLWYRRAAPSH